MGNVTLAYHGDYVVACLKGEFALGNSNEMKETVKQYLEHNHTYRLIVDLSQVDFIDSSGLGVLISWFKMTNQQQGNVIYVHPTSYVAKIIGFAKLDKIFLIVDSMEEAVAKL